MKWRERGGGGGGGGGEEGGGGGGRRREGGRGRGEEGEGGRERELEQNKAPSGARGDLVTCERALFTVCSTPQTAAPATQRCGRITSLEEAPSVEPN